MLTKIIQLNSTLCSKAIISLERDSVQLVGSNTLGKTSLINSLNFLFIIDGNKMQFGGNHDFQQSIHHYFPTINNSYLVFEIMKNERYCVLLKRDAQKNLEFYKIDSEYRDEHYYVPNNGYQRLLTFQELFENFTTLGIMPAKLATKQDLFNLVYQRGKDNNSVVWLQDTVKTSGLSNNFSKIYSYLINPQLINNNTLKDALIIADNRDGEQVNFAQGNKQDLYRLQDLSVQLQNTIEVQPDFEVFVEKVKECELKSERVGELYFAFETKFNKEIIDIENSARKTHKEIQSIESKIKNELKPKANNIQQAIGGKKAILQSRKSELEENTRLLKQVNNYGTLNMLKQSKENLEKQAREISFKIEQIQHYNYNQKDLLPAIADLGNKISQKKKQIEDYNKLLINHISPKDEVKALLNTVLSDKILQLTKKQIQQPVKNASREFLNIYDGKIKLPKNFEYDKFKSIASLKKELKELETDKKEKEGILKVVVGFDANQSKLSKIIAEIKSLENQLQQVGQKSVFQKKGTEIKNAISELEEEINDLLKQSEKIEKEEIRLTELDQALRKKEIDLGTRQERITEWNNNLKKEDINPSEYHSKKSVDEIYKEIIELIADLKTLMPEKDRLFNQLKHKTQRSEASEHDFISVINDELATIENKNMVIDDLLQSIAQSFSNPTFHLLDKFRHFKEYINNFNLQLSKIKISNIERIVIKVEESKRLIRELEQMSTLRNFTRDNLFAEELREDLRILKYYLEESKKEKIEFRELFEIKAEVTIHGNTKEIDFSRPIESTGADKVIRLIIILSIIHKLAVNHEANKIPICIDEVLIIDQNNTNQILQFCKENNFIPMFVAPHFITSTVIDRTYMLKKNEDGKATPIIYADRN